MEIEKQIQLRIQTQMILLLQLTLSDRENTKKEKKTGKKKDKKENSSLPFYMFRSDILLCLYLIVKGKMGCVSIELFP